LIKKTDTSEIELIICLQRTACFGTCPIYKIEIYTDGSGTYTGTRFVENIGVSEFQLSKSDVNNILEYANKIGFSKLNDEYSEAITDLPTTFIQIKDKRIRDYTGAPKKLKNLEKLIDQLYQKAIMK
jgi:hypothetical protein